MDARGQRIVRMVVVGAIVACCGVALVVGGVNAFINAGKNEDSRARVDAAMATVDADPQAAMDVLMAEIDANPDMAYAADADKLAALLAGFPPDILLSAAAGGAEAAISSNPEAVEQFEILSYAAILGTYPDSPEALEARTGLLTGGYYIEFDREKRAQIVGALVGIDDPAFFDELVARSQPDAGPDETLSEEEWTGKIVAQHTLAAKGQAGWEVLAAQVVAGDTDVAAAFESGGAGVVALLEPYLSIEDTAERTVFAGILGGIATSSSHPDREPAAAVLRAHVADPYVAIAALDFFMHEGDSETIPYLIDALNEVGGSGDAEVFLNSGNGDLEAAGRAWASDHGYDITTAPTSGGTGWGGQ